MKKSVSLLYILSSMQAICFVAMAKADTVLDADAAGKQIIAYWASEEYKNQYLGAVAKISPIILNKCPALKSSKRLVYFLDQFSVDDSGKLKSGMWKESYGFSGCGNDSAINFLFRVNTDQKIIIITALPGESRSSYILQNDALTNVFISASTHLKMESKMDCQQADVINTTVGKIENKQLVKIDPNTVVAKTPWLEVWTVVACDHKMLVPIQFIPDATGTTFSISTESIVDQ